MTQYIDKDALVAEIERLGERDYPCDTFEESLGYYNALNEMSTFLDTLEVKEVDLDSNIRAYLTSHFNVYEDGVLQSKKSSHPLSTYDIIKVAKHFYELGLNTQQNISIDITNIDKVMEENGVDPNSKEAKSFKELYYLALEKLKAQKGE